MFIPHIKIEKGTRVALKREYVLEDFGTFSEGHEFTVIDNMHGRFTLIDDEDHMLDVWREYIKDGKLLNLDIYPCLLESNFYHIRKLLVHANILLSGWSKYTRQEIGYQTFNTKCALRGLLKDMTDRLPIADQYVEQGGMYVLNRIDWDQKMVTIDILLNDFVYSLKFDETLHLVTLQQRARDA